MGFIVGFLVGLLIAGVGIAPASCQNCTQIIASLFVPLLAISSLMFTLLLVYQLITNKITLLNAAVQTLLFVIMVFIADELISAILLTIK